MTRTQKRVLAFVAGFIKRHGHSPSLNEIAAGIGLSATSKGAVSDHVRRLVERGYLRREPGAGARSLLVTDAGRAALDTLEPPIGVIDLAAVPTADLVAELGRRAHG